MWVGSNQSGLDVVVSQASFGSPEQPTFILYENGQLWDQAPPVSGHVVAVTPSSATFFASGGLGTDLSPIFRADVIRTSGTVSCTWGSPQCVAFAPADGIASLASNQPNAVFTVTLSGTAVLGGIQTLSVPTDPAGQFNKQMAGMFVFPVTGGMTVSMHAEGGGATCDSSHTF